MDQLGPRRQGLFVPFWSIIRTMKQTDPQFKLRLDEGLKAALTAAAKENNRTLSAEIVARLDRSFESYDITESNAGEFYVRGLNGFLKLVPQLLAELPPGFAEQSKCIPALQALFDLFHKDVGPATIEALYQVGPLIGIVPDDSLTKEERMRRADEAGKIMKEGKNLGAELKKRGYLK